MLRPYYLRSLIVSISLQLSFISIYMALEGAGAVNSVVCDGLSRFDFSSAEGFYQSLYSVLGVGFDDDLHLNRVYYVEEGGALLEYSNTDKSTLIYTNEDGDVISCKIVTEDEILKSAVRNSEYLSPLSYRNVFGGFVLEV